jgi:ketosteroid isomerase-like protein
VGVSAGHIKKKGRGMDQRMIDEITIRDLIARIALARSQGAIEDFMAFFTDDAQWERPGLDGGPARIDNREAEAKHGRENQAKGLAGPGSHLHHVIPMTVVDVDGDSAKATSQMVMLRKCDGEPEIMKMWILKDEVVRTPAGWKVRYRKLVKP